MLEDCDCRVQTPPSHLSLSQAGMIHTGKEEFFIEPLVRGGGLMVEEEESGEGRHHIVYRSSAIKRPPINQTADSHPRGKRNFRYIFTDSIWFSWLSGDMIKFLHRSSSFVTLEWWMQISLMGFLGLMYELLCQIIVLHFEMWNSYERLVS